MDIQVNMITRDKVYLYTKYMRHKKWLEVDKVAYNEG